MTIKMKTKLLIIIAIFYFSANYSQNCGTISPSTYSVFSSSGSNSFTQTTFCVNIRFHIVRRSNGNDGFNSNQIGNIVGLLNTSLYESQYTL